MDIRASTNGHPELYTTYGETSPFAEAYRSLRINLLQGREKSLWSLGITGARPGHGSTTTAANLALIMGETGRRVVLVDIDLYRPSLHRYFEISNQVGLSSVLQGEVRLEDALRTVAPPSLLRLLPAGPSVRNPAALLRPEGLETLFGQLRNETDLLIADLPSICAVAYSASLASTLDGVLLVVQAGSTAEGIDRVVGRQLKGANVIGIVLNRVPMGGNEISSYRHYARMRE